MPPRFRSRISLRGPALFLPCEAGSLGGRAHDGRCCRRGILPGGRACGRSVLRAGASSARWNVWRWAPSGELFPGIGTGDAPGGFGRVWTGLEEQSRAWTMPVEARGGGGDNHRAPEKRTRRSSKGSARLVFVGIGFFFLFSPSLSPWSGIRKAASATRCQNGRSPHLRSPGSEAPGPDQNGRSSTSAGVEA